MTTKELKIAYKIISQIMEDNSLKMDNSFVRVKNYIANKLCEIIISQDIE